MKAELTLEFSQKTNMRFYKRICNINIVAFEIALYHLRCMLLFLITLNVMRVLFDMGFA